MSGFDLWATADPDAVGNDNPEPPQPGNYDIELLDGSAFLSKKQEAWVSLKLRVVSAYAQGHEWDVLLGFRSQAAANFTKKTVRDLGIAVDEVAGLDELDTAIKECLGNYYAVEVVQNGDYRNTYFQAGPVAPDIPIPELGDPVPVPARDDEDIPFRARFPELGMWRETRWNEFS